MVTADNPIEIRFENIQRRGSSSIQFDLTVWLGSATSMAIIEPNTGRVYFERVSGYKFVPIRARGVHVGTSRPQFVFHRTKLAIGNENRTVVKSNDSFVADVELGDTRPRIRGWGNGGIIRIR